MGRGVGSGGRDARSRRVALALAVALFTVLIPAVALAAYPGSNPNESVRLNTPNDPGYDPAEPDGGPQTSTNVFDDQYARFGFAPNASQGTALYDLQAAPARQVAQNTAAGRNPLGQVSGVSADRAWKFFGEDDPNGLVGDPDVEIAILDTGINWASRSLRLRVSLNEGELPQPQLAGGASCGSDDCDGNGAFNVDDFADDPRVSPTDGNPNADAILDGSDLIAAFGNDGDTDGNGYPDDVAGWDFFDDDNDPFDASSYSAAVFHGTGRGNDAAQEGDDGDGGIGVCPDCQIVPLRVWDTFVVDTNNFAQGVLYAADNEVEVVEGAVGGLLNSRFARESFEYAYSKGTLPVIVSSDLNTADHNYPTNYDQALHVQGTVADVNGLGENPPQQFVDFFAGLPAPLPIGSNAPVQTWFRNSGTTQYGGHAHIVMPATTGSEATGQASGAAGLIISYANRKGITLQPNEVKQLLTRTAEDVDPRNTDGLGTPDPAQVGWDQHFGYGRPDLGLALQRVKNLANPSPANAGARVPPEALITGPDWFAPLNLEQQTSVEVSAELDARPASYEWELQWAPGIEPCESEFETIETGSETAPTDGAIGTVDLAEVRAALDARTGARGPVAGCQNMPGAVTGGSTPDPTAPAPGPGDVDPNEPAFTVRVQVTDAQGNVGEDRKVLFAYEDDTLHPGWSRPLGGSQNDSGEATSGGESSQRMYDLDGDNRLEIIEATSSGRLFVLDDDGSPSEEFNHGQPVSTRRYFNVHAGAPGYDEVAPPNEALRVPAIGDIDGDREPEIVVSAGQRVYAWEADGDRVQGFPVRIDLSKSPVSARSYVNHIKPGFLASPALGDLDDDGDLEIAIAGLDQQLYVWRGDGSPMPDFPVYLRERSGGSPIPCSSGFECAESINTPSIGDIDGDGSADIVVATNEFDDNPSAPGEPATLGGLSGLLTNFLAGALGGSSRVYAVDADGQFLDGWPITVDGLLPDALPFVGPGVDQTLADIDDDPELEVIGNAATGDVIASDGDGSTIVNYDSQPQSGETVDKSKVLNLFENPVVANLDGSGGLEVVKGGQTLLGLVNLGILTGQNLPYNHVLQSWSAEPSAQGQSLPAFPQAVEDYQLLSSPAVADVSDAPGNEAIVGTGLYLIRNINSTGVEGTGWPKFTGGWNFAVPSVGDIDGNGTLEVAAQTREGFSFVWDTGADACGAGNAQWWTFRHDEFNSGAYETDARPPGTPRRLRAEREGEGARLSWTAPGDDWLCGRGFAYRILLSTDRIEHPADADREQQFPAPQPPGSRVRRTLSKGTIGNARHAAVIYRDDAGNWGHLAAIKLPARGGGGGGGNPGACKVEISGTAGADRLVGTAASERILGRRGKDRISAGGSGDCVRGGGSGDRARGQAGKDRLNGGSGNDSLRGNGGNDLIRGATGSDRLAGGSGDDRIQGKQGSDRIAGGPGDDVLRAGQKPDRVSGGDGADSIETVGGGADVVSCGGGRDLARVGRSDRVDRSCERVMLG